jgi:hypothetical protein
MIESDSLIRFQTNNASVKHSPDRQQEMRDAIEKQTAEFIANGGEIKVFETELSAPIFKPVKVPL